MCGRVADVTTAEFPLHGRRQRLRSLAVVVSALSVLHRAMPVGRNLAQVPFTVAGIACVDVGVFVASAVAGWIVTGLSLILLELLIADES